MRKKIIYISLVLSISIALLYFIFKNTNNFNELYDSNVYIETINDDGINIGSGFVYKIKGNKAYIVTCYHILNDTDEIYVYNIKNNNEKAQLLYYDDKSDIAVLSIDNTLNLKESKIGNSNKLHIGDNIYALGTPLNDAYSYSLTSGIISYLNRSIVVNNNKYNAIQIDAPISGGNSGGVLLNKKGKVIGMIFVTENGSNGISFAIPINSIINEIKGLKI